MATTLTGVSWGLEASSAEDDAGTPDVPCWHTSLRNAAFRRGHLGLRRPRDEAFSVWQLALVITAADGSEETWKLADLNHVKRFESAAQSSEAAMACLSWCAGAVAPIRPALVGFEVESCRGKLVAAAPAGEVEALGRLRQIHAWVCHALEDLSAETEEHSMTPHAWASGISVEWPLGSKQDALKHLAAMHYQLNMVDVRQVDVNSRFAGSECPVCLEQWASMPTGTSVAALPCGHCCC
eukprot:TRINITY_DN13760_c1_g5_i1.p1 TRINITY_DN13760_c1_g5~~TRINITY_DN13760_c1_g5_i1.p1  ORF type:complete len:239 (+),score=46.07 TRINITY_DN13760_c1_g5_i1:163-879(+)